MLELSVCVLLQVVLLVGKEVFPLKETVAKIGLLVLLSIGEELEPVFDNLAHLDPLAPPIKHFWLQIIVCAVAVLPAGYGTCDQLEAILFSQMRSILDLIFSEAL